MPYKDEGRQKVIESISMIWHIQLNSMSQLFHSSIQWFNSLTPILSQYDSMIQLIESNPLSQLIQPSPMIQLIDSNPMSQLIVLDSIC